MGNPWISLGLISMDWPWKRIEYMRFSSYFGTMKFPQKSHGFFVSTGNHGFSMNISLCHNTMKTLGKLMDYSHGKLL